MMYFHTIQALLDDLIHAFRAQINPNNLFGAIGPYSSIEVEFWAPIFQHFNLFMVRLYMHKYPYTIYILMVGTIHADIL